MKLSQSYELEFSADGGFIICLGRSVVLWDINLRKKRFRAHPLSHPSDSSIHPSGASFLIKNTSGRIVHLDSSDGSLIRQLADEKEGEGSNLLFSEDGAHVINGSWSGILSVRDVQTGAVEFSASYPHEMIVQLASNRLSGRWYVLHSPKVTDSHSSPAPRYLTIWEWPFDRPIDLIELGIPNFRTFALSPDGKRICVLTQTALKVIELSDRSVISEVPYRYGGTDFAVAWATDGSEIAVPQRGAITFHSADSLDELRRYDLQYACAVQFSPDPAYVALGSWSTGLVLPRALLG